MLPADVLEKLYVENGVIKSTFSGLDTLTNIQMINLISSINPANHQLVRIVGLGGYADITSASDDAADGTIIYVADTGNISGTIKSSGLSIVFADDVSNSNTIVLTMDNNIIGNTSVDIYGERRFILNGSNTVDIIRDNTILSAGQNTINGNGGDDVLIALTNSHTSILNGGAGNDTLIGGAGDQLYGGDGSDTLLALNGAAYLSGGAGSDILVNAFLGADGVNTVRMLGGSGNDTFALMSNGQVSSGGRIMTTVSDLTAGDRLDLSFLETSSGVDFTGISNLAGKASLVNGAFTLNLSGMIVSSDNGGQIGDINSVLSSGPNATSQISLVGANATTVSNAINTAFISSPINSYIGLFGELNDAYPSNT